MVKTVCLFCSLGCELGIEADGSEARRIVYLREGRVNKGALCPRGNSLLELVNHPARLTAAIERREGRLVQLGFDEAIQRIGERLRDLKDGLAVIVSGLATNEEAKLAAKLGGENTALGAEPGELGLLMGAGDVGRGTPEELAESGCTIAIGDPFTLCPVLSRWVLQARYKSRDNLLITVGFKRGRTSWFSDEHIGVKPGFEGLALGCMVEPSKLSDRLGEAAERIREAAERFRGAERGFILIAGGFGSMADPISCGALARRLVESCGEGKYLLPLFVYGNLEGAYKSAKPSKTVPRIIEGIREGRIKALISLGYDLLSSYPHPEVREALGKLELFVVSAPFENESAKIAHFVLPSSVWPEKGGTVLTAFGIEHKLEPVLPPPGDARGEGEIAEAIADAAGLALGGEAEGGKVEIDPLGRLERFKPPEGELVLGFELETMAFADGSITGKLSWASRSAPRPALSISPADAAGLGDGDEVVISREGAEIKLPVRISALLPEGVATLPSWEAKARGFIPWRVDPETGELITAPVAVSVRKA